MTHIPDEITDPRVRAQYFNTHVDLRGCTGLTEVPAFPMATHVDLRGCTGLGEPLFHDPRDYELRRLIWDGQEIWLSGCRLFRGRDAALSHWGPEYQGSRAIGDAYCAAINQTPEYEAQP